MELYANKLRAGVHFGPDYTAPSTVEKVKNPVTGVETERRVWPTKQFNRGDVFHGPEDLVAAEPGRWETPTGPRKRETVKVDLPDPAPSQFPAPVPDELKPARNPGLETVPQQSDRTRAAQVAQAGVKDAADKEAAYRAELEQMTVADLREHAREGGVQLHGASTKADIVDAILKGDKVGDSDDGK